jgi:2-isopropylmalate synthase
MNMKNSTVSIYDTTLRDGTQSRDISLSCEDKLRIARKLDDIGFSFIEGGWPGSNPKDVEFFEKARLEKWKTAKIAAFGATCRAKSQPEDDANIQAMLGAQTPVCTIVGKSWTLHVQEVLKTTLEDNLRIIESSLAYLLSQSRQVIYDAEHFFDGFKSDPEYALATLKAAERGGAETLVLCDTNGGSMPWEIADIIAAVKKEVHTPLGIHVHNDGDCAVANTLAAVQQGCIHVQGTINGYGERCGNANLCSVIPNLELKLGIHCLPDGGLAKMFDLSHFVAEVANLAPNEYSAYVGTNAFAHKGGIHVAAMRRNKASYQHIEPELVGNRMQVVISELSGKGNLISKAEEYGMGPLQDDSVSNTLTEIKTLESRGFTFEAAEASAIMLLKRREAGYQVPFELIDFKVEVEHRPDGGIFSEAMVIIQVGREILRTNSDGDGPVNALDKALRKALVDTYPEIGLFHLADYKVRILDGENGTRAITRVLIDTQDHHQRWSTVGASSNIIEASWQALVDSIEYGLTLTKGAGKGS